MLCKRSEPTNSELFDTDEEFVEIDTDDDNETYETVAEESNTEQRNDTEGEGERRDTAEYPRIVGQSEIDDSYELQSIIGATHCDGQMYFFVKWTHSDSLELVQSRVLNVTFPSQVIAFYEQRIRFLAVEVEEYPENYYFVY